MHALASILRSTLVMLALFCAAAALGDITVNAARGEVTVNTTLSQPTAEVGEAVQLQVEVAGHSGSVQPPQIKVDGLSIDYVGPSTRRELEMTNGGFRQHTSTTHIYRVTAQQTGAFQIPALSIPVNGQIYRTQPVGLRVEKGRSAGSTAGDEKTAFAELVVPRKTAFVGEMLPVELNFYLDANASAELEQMPGITGTGFTSQKMPEPRQRRAQKSGREWKVVSFRTAITPSKAGTITLGPMDIPFVAEVQRQRPRSRDPFDSFFNDPFFDRARGGERRRYTVQAPAVELEVKPLPVNGRPAEFSGAIGEFKLAAEGSPKRVKIGDPVTMRLKISGTGNFDRMQAPALVDPAGWHAYPPSETFEPGDDLKTTGTKTFEVPVVPETTHATMPRFQFAYFDPQSVKYVILTSDAAPLVVEGLPPPAAPPLEAQPLAKTTPTAASNPPGGQAAADILGLRYDSGSTVATFTPLYMRREFLLVQLVPLGVLLAVLGRRIIRRSDGAARISALRRERERLLRGLRVGKADLYDAASRLLQVETAIVSGVNPATVGAEEARRALRPDEETAAVIDDVFGARAEALYAGSGAGSSRPEHGDGTRLRTTLEAFFKSRA